MAENPIDGVALGLLGGGALLIAAPEALSPSNPKLARLFGAAFALAGAFRILQRATQPVVDIVGAPIELAQRGALAGQKLGDRAIDTVEHAGIVVADTADRLLEEAERAKDRALDGLLGPPEPPAFELVPRTLGELAPAAELPPPVLGAGLGLGPGATRIGAFVVTPPDGGEVNVGALDRYAPVEIELQNYTTTTQRPFLEYIATVTPLGPFGKQRKIRKPIHVPTDLKAGGTPLRIRDARIDLGGNEPFNMAVSLELLVNGTRVSGSSFTAV